jgi:hypothetical protein
LNWTPKSGHESAHFFDSVKLTVYEQKNIHGGAN